VLFWLKPKSLKNSRGEPNATEFAKNYSGFWPKTPVFQGRRFGGKLAFLKKRGFL
jgi:hypothetical protein